MDESMATSDYSSRFTPCILKGNSPCNIDIIKLSPNASQGIHNGYIIRFHVACLILRDGNLSYFVFGWQPEIFWEDSGLMGLGKLTATFAQHQNLKNSINFLK